MVIGYILVVLALLAIQIVIYRDTSAVSLARMTVVALLAASMLMIAAGIAGKPDPRL